MIYFLELYVSMVECKSTAFNNLIKDYAFLEFKFALFGSDGIKIIGDINILEYKSNVLLKIKNCCALYFIGLFLVRPL